MKKVLLLSLIALFSMCSYAQKITVDKMVSDGRHQIMGNMKHIRFDDRYYSFTLMVYESESNLDWRVIMSTFKTIPLDNIVLLKLKNGQTISLAIDSLEEKSYTTNSVVYNSTFLSTVQPGVTKPYYVTESRIKAEELDSIDTYGITKIRVGNNVKYYEEEWSNNPLGKHLTKCRKKIMESLKNSTNNNRNSKDKEINNNDSENITRKEKRNLFPLFYFFMDIFIEKLDKPRSFCCL